MTNILVACHCKTPMSRVTSSKKMYILSPSLVLKSQSDKIEPSITVVSYIETDKTHCPESENQYHTWEIIPNKSIDYVWFQHCPLWQECDSCINTAVTLVENALRVLKVNGYIIVAGYGSDEKDIIESHNLHIKKILSDKNVKVNIVSQKDLPFIMISERPSDNYEADSPYLVLTKLPSSGGKKRKYTLKKSKKSRKLKRRL